MTQDPIPGIDPGWSDALQPVAGQIAAMGDFLRAEIAAGRKYLPAGDQVLRAFQQPFGDVRVLIVGQDPYPTPGHPVGLSFSVAPEVRRLPAQPGQHLPRIPRRPRLPGTEQRGPQPVDRARA